MFYALLGATLVVALLISYLLTRVFDSPIDSILARVIKDEIASAYRRYITFAIYVVGVSSGIQVWNLEKYITVSNPDTEIVQLTTERWTLEIFRAVVGTLQGVAWMLLVFFLVMLIAFVIVRIGESRHAEG